MNPPRLERVVTAEGCEWRIHYAGMIKVHRQEWQAMWYYRQVCDAYVQSLADR